MNNVLLNLFIYVFEYICGYAESDIQFQCEKSYDSYFLYDLETFEIIPL